MTETSGEAKKWWEKTQTIVGAVSGVLVAFLVVSNRGQREATDVAVTVDRLELGAPVRVDDGRDEDYLAKLHAKKSGAGLRNFGSLTKTIETNVHTDIPLNRLPSLVRLLTGVEPKQTLTVTFGLDYVFARRKADRHPVPNLSRMRTTVRNAILNPELLKKTGKAKTTRESC